jgi:uncharacterized membrane protein YvbJ
MVDEGPSAEDIERFGDETGHCPECGAEIWDDIAACPACGAWIAGGTRSRPPQDLALREQRRRQIAILLAVVISGLVGFLLLVL